MIAVDLGGTRLRTALFESGGVIAGKSVVPTPRENPSMLYESIREMLESAHIEVAEAVVGVPGPVDYAQGRAIRLPNLPDWGEYLNAERIAANTGLPVYLANDADLAALGEHRYGAGRGVPDMLYMTSSTGVGGGVILNGRLLHGQRSLAEVGHVIVDRDESGTVERLGSGTALRRLTGEHGAETVAKAAAGDKQAIDALREVAEAFAIGVYNAVHCFMPERVVIGGGVSQAGELLLVPIRDRLRSCAGCAASGVEAVIASGGDDVGLLGAFAFWQDAQTEPERSDHSPAQPRR